MALGSYPQAARSETGRGNGALLTQGLDKPSACPHSPTPTTTVEPPPSTMDHPHIRHKSLPMVRRYIRDGSLFRRNAAAAVGL